MNSTPGGPLDRATEKALEEAFKAARDFLATIGGPAATEFGGSLGDWMKYWRFRNMITISLKAKAFLVERGIDPRRVLPATMIPLLEAASLTDDDSLQAKWAALLASAADPRDTEVPVSYVSILSELSPLEVQVLDYAFVRAGSELVAQARKRTAYWILENEIIHRHRITAEHAGIIGANVSRLGLWSSAVETIRAQFDPLATEELRRTYEDSSGEELGGWVDRRVYRLTPLGIDLIRRCHEHSELNARQQAPV